MTAPDETQQREKLPEQDGLDPAKLDEARVEPLPAARRSSPGRPSPFGSRPKTAGR